MEDNQKMAMPEIEQKHQDSLTVEAAASEEKDTLPIPGEGNDRLSTSEAKVERPKSGKGDKQIQEIRDALEKISGFDEKLAYVVEKMEETLAQGGTPLFKVFWELRKFCQAFFKESISPAARAQYWEKYNELSKQARKLKEIFDAQSAFATEQIEIAIAAIEKDVGEFETQQKPAPNASFNFPPKSLGNKIGYYSQIQGKLDLLNAHASRVNTLRKELIKTDMRIVVKNKFFQRLSSAGDAIFPTRKELIKEVSERFIQDVKFFKESYFSKDTYDKPLHELRDEIKSWQTLAKFLTLNTQAFSESRKTLSECWEKLKEVGKEMRKERLEKREVYEANKLPLQQKISQISDDFAKGDLTVGAAEKAFDELTKEMRSVELGPVEVKELHQAISEAKRPMREKSLQDEQARKQKEKDLVEELKRQYQSINEKIDALKNELDNFTASELKKEVDTAQNAIEEAVRLPNSQKEELKRKLRPLHQILVRKSEDELLSLSDDDKASLDALRSVLKQRRNRRKAIKEQVDALKKEASLSGLDIMKSLEFHDRIVEEELLLDEADEGIAEMETSLQTLKLNAKKL